MRARFLELWVCKQLALCVRDINVHARKEARGCLVSIFKEQFLVFKQYFTYFNTFYLIFYCLQALCGSLKSESSGSCAIFFMNPVNV